ncbi:DMT family transporter [Pontiella agarivorans]|uniref:SMR family transporter n=1 Tax=Pontiella agarivorans TaxID=3038953 RepID=A0ABU5MXP6_9BACT|nr:SMR family transporter [Pontiella agarivorans]MDZ8118968.1 SMR family transporter [Pontiella agarivorans]
MKLGWFILFLSMLADVAASLMAKQLDGLRRPFRMAAVIGLYALTMGLFTYCMKVLPIGPAFAIWSGVGMVLISVLSMVFYRQIPDGPAIVGMSLIVLGTVVLSTMSKMQVH